MSPVRRAFSVLAAALLLAPAAATAQFPGMQGPPGPGFTSDNPVIRRIWSLGMDSSQTYRPAQVLLDSIGPRRVGSPAYLSAGDWLVNTYRAWGVTARQERYGTWAGWRRGRSYISLMAPRVRTLEGTMLAFSPSTGGRPARGKGSLACGRSAPSRCAPGRRTRSSRPGRFGGRQESG